MLSFTVNDKALIERLNKITEKYVALHCDAEFKSLAYFYNIIEIKYLFGRFL